MGMTAGQAFTARELHRDGIWSGRIADLLDLDERDVLRALRDEPIEDEAASMPAREPAQPPPLAPPPDPNAWPPPVDDSTEWDMVRIARGWAQGGDDVRVRWVMLWGQRVRINDAAEVWCHSCLRFHTSQELSHPFNGCPVGLPYRGGVVTVDAKQMAADDARLALLERRTGPLVDFMRTPW